MTNEETMYWWLNRLRDEGKNATDPTYLMQAFSLTRKKALEVIQGWQVYQLDGFPMRGKEEEVWPRS